ncbi:hypothetical protein BGLT_02456 [Caballeronia glathei]|uniref:Uncharacterized protein n=1 Tax=Caballeronia glathei TaxID=60547 RepID=A0A069PSF0_9BURK|nr:MULTISPECIES: hypothetical protein [Burkholderiaceae]KDR40201.1 hypothetical protein BG61_26880 [Caballeronia glathei]TCK38104.1 hypothetical protein B0G84_3407 [Paraburkholderia sp. BL8N3]CDY79774.1 hypothetical protein BGLT_02456 [Caballeronia glathei]
MKNPQVQGVIERGTNRAGEAPYEPAPVRTMPEASSDDSGYCDSLDIPLDYGIVMEAVRDAVRANL